MTQKRSIACSDTSINSQRCHHIQYVKYLSLLPIASFQQSPSPILQDVVPDQEDVCPAEGLRQRRRWKLRAVQGGQVRPQWRWQPLPPQGSIPNKFDFPENGFSVRPVNFSGKSYLDGHCHVGRGRPPSSTGARGASSSPLRPRVIATAPQLAVT